MTVTVPVPTQNPGDALQSARWNTYLAANINKLLNQGHRVLTVAQFAALTGLEDGDEVYLEVDATNEVQWHLRYKASSARWRFLGGPPMSATVATGETTTSGTYVDLTTAGPSLTVPRTGAYTIARGATIHNGGTVNSYAAVKLGAAATSDAQAVVAGVPTDIHTARRTYNVALNASDVAKMQYRVDGGTGTFANRTVDIKPVYLT